MTTTTDTVGTYGSLIRSSTVRNRWAWYVQQSWLGDYSAHNKHISTKHLTTKSANTVANKYMNLDW